MSENTKSSLYHYTTFSALKGILEKGEIWLSNLKDMNDRKEITQHIENIEKSVLSIMKEKNLDNYENITRKDEIFTLAYKYYKSGKAFAFCLTTESDDSSLWHIYADRGNGVAIEFDKTELIKDLKKIYPFFKVNDVFYQKEIPNHDEHLRLFVDYIRTGHAKLSGEECSVEDLVFNLMLSSIVYKNHTFKNERESRLVVYYTEVLKKIVENEYARIDKVVENNSKKEVLKLNFGDISVYDLIKSITIGPASNKSIDDINYLLGYDNPITIKYSESTLR